MKKMNMLEKYVSEKESATLTENGAAAFSSTGIACVNMLFRAGAMRWAPDSEIVSVFSDAFIESPLEAMRLLFHVRDARGGMGERRFFRLASEWLAENHTEAIIKNLRLISEYGRWDDLVSLFGTKAGKAVVEIIRSTLAKDAVSDPSDTTLLAKWMPSVNASSGRARSAALSIAKSLGMSAAEYRKTLSKIRRKLDLVENRMREKDYTFDYAAVPSVASLKYRAAFARNDGERYHAYIKAVSEGRAKINASVLAPYQIVRNCFGYGSDDEREVLDAMWDALPNFCSNESILTVVDGSGSMYGGSGEVRPIDVALSLGIYHAERNSGPFAGSFVTFSETPQLVKIKGDDIVEKVRFCESYDEVANTNLEAVFNLILAAAKTTGADEADMPDKILILSDMEFDSCAKRADRTVFREAKRKFEKAGYRLPEVIFWNIESRHANFPVTAEEEGAILVSGFSPAILSMMTGELNSPLELVERIVASERYAAVTV